MWKEQRGAGGGRKERIKDGEQLEKGGKIREEEFKGGRGGAKRMLLGVKAVQERPRARMQPLTGRLLVSNVDMLRRVAGLESSTFFLAALNSRLFGGT